MESAVIKLMIRPFSHRAFDEQLSIVREGRTIYDFNINPQDDCSETQWMKSLLEKVYCENEWLTCCPIWQRLYCFPCLLFNNPKSPWSSKGYSDWHSLLKSMREHMITYEHIQAELQLKMFHLKYAKPLELAKEAELKKQADFLKIHRESLILLVNTIIWDVVNKEQPSTQIFGEYSATVNPVTCLRHFELAREYSTGYASMSEFATQVIKQTPKVLDDAVNAINVAIKSEIMKEVSFSSFVAIILNEHSEVSDKSVVSTVLRYNYDSKVFERFIGFTNTITRKQAGDVLQHILSVLNEYNITKKQFLAYSLACEVLPSSELILFVKLMEERFPYCFFSPWHSHDFNTFLQQSVICIKECNFFFKTMNAIKNYFNKKSRRSDSFSQFMLSRNDPTDDTKPFKDTTFKSPFKKNIVSVAHKYRKEMIEYFNSVVADPGSWEADEIAYAFGFSQFLQQFRTIFLFYLFSKMYKIMEQTRFYPKNGDSKSKTLFYPGREAFITTLTSMRDDYFETLWVLTVKETSDPFLYKTAEYRKLFHNILNNILEQVPPGFEDLNKFQNTYLLLFNNWAEINLSFSVTKLANDFKFGHYLESENLLNELDVLLPLESSLPSVRTFETLYMFFMKSGMKDVLPNLFRLIEMCWTFPINDPPSSTRRKYKDIKKQSCYYCDNVVQRYDKEILRVEVDLLLKLKQSTSFYDQVIKVFSPINETTIAKT